MTACRRRGATAEPASCRSFQRQLDRVAQLRRHVDQRIQREIAGAASYQVIHAGLGDIGALGRFGLGDVKLGDDLADMYDQVGSQQQVLSFSFGKPRSRNTLSLPMTILSFLVMISCPFFPSVVSRTGCGQYPDQWVRSSVFSW